MSPAFLIMNMGSKESEVQLVLTEKYPEPIAVHVACSPHKYKGKWGIMKPAKTILIAYNVGSRRLYIDLQVVLSPEQANEFIDCMAFENRVRIGPPFLNSERVEIRHDAEARLIVRSFHQLIWPKLVASAFGEHFKVESYYCGEIQTDRKPSGGEKNVWDDSKEYSRQYVVLDDGKVILAIVWGESGETYLEYRVPIDGLDSMDKGSLIQYLGAQGCNVFDNPAAYEWSFSIKDATGTKIWEYVLQTALKR